MIRHLPIFVRALALVMATLVAAPASGVGQLFFCSMTGEVGQRCGCEHEVATSSVNTLSVSTAPCCEAVDQQSRVQPVRVEALSSDFDGPDAVAAHPVPAAQRHVSVASPRLLPYPSRGPPFATGPPLYIENCAYLI